MTHISILFASSRQKYPRPVTTSRANEALFERLRLETEFGRTLLTRGF